jgi:hypothetical protein
MTCTTIVSGWDGSGTDGGEGGWGTIVGNPVGAFGVITMKMMISTSSTSINGTILGSETGPFLAPRAISMATLLTECIVALVRAILGRWQPRAFAFH